MITISFEAYCSDNHVDELPGIQLPCNSHREDLENTEEEYIHTVVVHNRREFIRDFRKWTRKVAQEAWSVGGDDTYYDYYPGNFDAAHEIAKAIPEVKDDVKFMEDFAIAVCYGPGGILDGLCLTADEGEAYRRWGEVMGQKMFANAHLQADQIDHFGGYFFQMAFAKPLWGKKTKRQAAEDRNQTSRVEGIPADLLPYTEERINYFAGEDRKRK